MRSRLTIGIISGMLLTLFTPTSLKAQAKGDLGTSRQQQTCPSRLEPRTGVINAAQAIKYATCEAEADRPIKYSGRTDFIDITSLQVDPKPRPANDLDIHYFGKAIAKAAVYEITGTAVAYSCAALANYAGGGRPGKNCLNTHPDDRGANNSLGVCFKEPSGNWRCRLGVGKARLEYGPPPNNVSAPSSSVTQSNPNSNGEDYIKRAEIRWDNKDYQGSLADLSRAIQINPNNAELYSKRGSRKFLHLQDRAGAIKDWQQAAKLFRQQGDTTSYKFMLDLIKKYKNN
jgi:tetratricopeptide (TPR) repeat protein